LSRTAYPYRYESEAVVAAPAEVIFDELDDHRRLSAHMAEPSWIMLGSRMDLRFDTAGGRAVGSRIRLDGRVLGIPLAVEEAVVERISPTRKVWQTIGTPGLLVVAGYRMGFEITPAGLNAKLRIFIDYDLPRGGRSRWLGRLFGARYARWCVERMLSDAVARFAPAPHATGERAGS